MAHWGVEAWTEAPHLLLMVRRPWTAGNTQQQGKYDNNNSPWCLIRHVDRYRKKALQTYCAFVFF
tara:strand:- start:185 stop:379 length:195 start_codon:yes stop_codon:yes gene_type:complete